MINIKKWRIKLYFLKIKEKDNKIKINFKKNQCIIIYKARNSLEKMF